MKKLINIGKWTVIVLVTLNLLIIATGNTHLYFGIRHTYLKGAKGPSPDEYNIFSNRKIEKGIPQPWAQAHRYNKLSLSSQQRKEIESLKPLSFLLIHRDSLLYEEYWENRTAKDISNSFSMAKTIVSILTGVAIGEGLIKDIDQPVGDYLPEFAEGDNKQLTIRHLLTMSSGIDFDEDYVSPFAYPAKAYYGTNIRKLTMKYKVAEEPGKIFRYLSGNTQLLAFVLEKATGKTISEFAAEKLMQPMGAESDALWNLDHENGVEKAYCCFISTARDFARMGKLYMNDGKWNNEQLVPIWYVRESVRPAPLLDVEGLQQKRYGYSWWMTEHRGHNIFYARGILGQYIICIPDLDIICVRLGRERLKEKQDDHPLDLYIYIDAAIAMAKQNKFTVIEE
jgi:CubicO group peptidase (beta-lactamase class C family)